MRICGRAGIGRKQGLVSSSCRLKLYLKTQGHHSWVVSSGETKAARCQENEEAETSVRAQLSFVRCHTHFSHPLLSKECSCWGEPCYPRGIFLARWLCCVQETAHHIGIPPVQILKISYFKNKVFFVEETKEHIVKKNKEI